MSRGPEYEEISIGVPLFFPLCRNEISAGPLMDGMVVSRRILSLLVRQTATNMCSRFRMESEW